MYQDYELHVYDSRYVVSLNQSDDFAVVYVDYAASPFQTYQVGYDSCVAARVIASWIYGEIAPKVRAQRKILKKRIKSSFNFPLRISPIGNTRIKLLRDAENDDASVVHTLHPRKDIMNYSIGEKELDNLIDLTRRHFEIHNS